MSGSPGLSGSARPVTAAQKSAEGIVAGSPAKARTTDRVSRTATLMRTKRQNIQLELALEPAAKGEARSAGAQGTEARTARAEPERPATPSNRRVRPRTHGGVGGEEPRGSPLSRLRSGPSDDSALAPASELVVAGRIRPATENTGRMTERFSTCGRSSGARHRPGPRPAADDGPLTRERHRLACGSPSRPPGRRPGEVTLGFTDRCPAPDGDSDWRRTTRSGAGQSPGPARPAYVQIGTGRNSRRQAKGIDPEHTKNATTSGSLGAGRTRLVVFEQRVVDFPGNEAFQAADDVFLRQALGGASSDVVEGRLVPAHADDHDPVVEMASRKGTPTAT